eukprot:jgi/Mesvir1/18184/Mv09471-RA.1
MEASYEPVNVTLRYRDDGQVKDLLFPETLLDLTQDVKAQITQLPGFPARLRGQQETCRIICADGTAWQPGRSKPRELYALFDEVEAPMQRIKIQHPTQPEGTIKPEFLSLHGMRAEHLVLAEPIDNSFQALLYAKDDSQPKRINLSVYSPDKIDNLNDFRKGHIVISDNGVGMDVKRLANWATDHYRPVNRIIPEEDPNPDQDAWKDPNPFTPGTAEHKAFEERRKLMEEYFCDGRLAKRGTGSKAAGFYLGEDLIMITKMKGEAVCELRLSTEEFERRRERGEDWFVSEVTKRPRGSWVGSFVESHLSACKPLVQHIKDMEANHDHFTIFIISSLKEEQALHIMATMDRARARTKGCAPIGFKYLCRQLRHVYFFMLSLGQRPYVGGPVELTAAFVYFKAAGQKNFGEEVAREERCLHERDMKELEHDDGEDEKDSRDGEESKGEEKEEDGNGCYVDRYSLLHKWAAKRKGVHHTYEFTIDSGSDGSLEEQGSLKRYGEQIKVRLWYLPSCHVDTLKRVKWPLEQQLEVFYKGRLMPYEFVPSVLLPMGSKVKDAATLEQLNRVRGAIFLGSNPAVHNTKWSLNPPLETSLERSSNSNCLKNKSRNVMSLFEQWLHDCHLEHDKRVALTTPFRGEPPQGLEGDLFQRMTYGRVSYIVGEKVVVQVKKANSPDYMKIVGSIVAFKKQDKLAPATPNQAGGGRGRGIGRRANGANEADASIARTQSGGGSDEEATACTMYLLREPQSIFACPEGVVPSPHLWEVSSRYLQEDGDVERLLMEEFNKVPRTLTATVVWPPAGQVCHEPLVEQDNCTTRLELRNGAGTRVPKEWDLCFPRQTQKVRPKVIRKVFLSAGTDGGADSRVRELAFPPESVTLLNLTVGFEFPGFVVHKPGSYRVEYALEEPRLPWCEQFPQPTCTTSFLAVVGPPKAFEPGFPTLRHLPAPGSPADTLPTVRLGELFEVAISFFDKEKGPEDNADTSRNACTEFDPAALRVKVSTAPEDRLGTVAAEVVGATGSSGKGQPLRAVLQLKRREAHPKAKIPPVGTVQTVVFNLEGPGGFSPLRQRLLLFPGPAVPQPAGEEGDDFVGLEGNRQVVNRETTLRFKVRFHDSEGNETRCFPPHSRVTLLVTRLRVGTGGAGTQPDVLLERTAVFGADGKLDAIPSPPYTSCQGELFLDEEGDIAVHGLRMNLDFSPPLSGSGNGRMADGDLAGNESESLLSDLEGGGPAAQAVDVQVSLQIPAGGDAAAPDPSPGEDALGRRSAASAASYVMIDKVKALQVLPSSRPTRVHLCYDNGMAWQEASLAESRGGAAGAGECVCYELRGIPAGNKLPKLAVRVESETGEKLLGPVLEGEAPETGGTGQSRSDAPGWEFKYKYMRAGSVFVSGAAFKKHGIIPDPGLPPTADVHLVEVEVMGTRQGSGSGSDRGSGQEVEFLKKFQVRVKIVPGPHTKWSIMPLPNMTPLKSKKAQGKLQADLVANAVASNGPPSLVLGQPLSQSRLAFVPLDAYNNCVPVQDAPTLRVVPRRAGEEGQEAVTFLAEALRTDVDRMGLDVDDEEEEAHKVEAPEGGGHTQHPEQVRPMDTLQGGYLRKVTGQGHGQLSVYFCFSSDADAYLYKQEPLPSSSAGQGSGPVPSMEYAFEISSKGLATVTSKVDVEISNPSAGSKSFIRVHSMPDSHLMAWQEISGAWGEIRVGPLPGGYSVRAFDRHVRRLCLEAKVPSLELRKKDLLLSLARHTRVEPRETRSHRHLAGGQQGAASRAGATPAVAPVPVDPPGVVVATVSEDGIYQFPPFFTVRVGDGPSGQGDDASVVVRAEVEGHGISCPEGTSLGFNWRPNPDLVKRLVIQMADAGTPERPALVAGSPAPRFEVALQAEDGVTRAATLDDAPDLKVILKNPAGNEIRLRPQAEAAPRDTAYFTPLLELTAAGGYQVVATWTDDRIPDRRTDVKSLYAFEVRPGPASTLVAPRWQPGCFDNLARTQLFRELDVHCTDRFGNRVTEYSGTLELSVLPRDAQPGGGLQEPEYATLADGHPRFEITRERDGVVTIPAQHLRARAGRVDGDYVLQLAPVSNAGVLEPLRLAFSFINQHGLSENLQRCKRDVMAFRDRITPHAEIYQKAVADHKAAEDNHRQAHHMCSRPMTDARKMFATCQPLPSAQSPDCVGVLQQALALVQQAHEREQREAKELEAELRSRPVRDGLSEEQRRAVINARARGSAYGTLLMLTAVRDAGDAKLLSCLSPRNMRLVVLTPSATLEDRQRLRKLRLPVCVIDEAWQHNHEEQLPHERLMLSPPQITGNPRFATSVVELNNAEMLRDRNLAGMMRNVIHAALGTVLILDRAEDAESYVTRVAAACRQRGQAPRLPRVISRDGRYQRESSGIERPEDPDLPQRIRGAVNPCFGAPSPEVCPRLSALTDGVRRTGELLNQLTPALQQFTVATAGLQAAKEALTALQEAHQERERELARLTALCQRAEEEQRVAEARTGAAGAAAPAGSNAVDSEDGAPVAVGSRRPAPDRSNQGRITRARMGP